MESVSYLDSILKDYAGLDGPEELGPDEKTDRDLQYFGENSKILVTRSCCASTDKNKNETYIEIYQKDEFFRKYFIKGDKKVFEIAKSKDSIILGHSLGISDAAVFENELYLAETLPGRLHVVDLSSGEKNSYITPIAIQTALGKIGDSLYLLGKAGKDYWVARRMEKSGNALKFEKDELASFLETLMNLARFDINYLAQINENRILMGGIHESNYREFRYEVYGLDPKKLQLSSLKEIYSKRISKEKPFRSICPLWFAFEPPQPLHLKIKERDYLAFSSRFSKLEIFKVFLEEAYEIVSEKLPQDLLPVSGVVFGNNYLVIHGFGSTDAIKEMSNDGREICGGGYMREDGRERTNLRAQLLLYTLSFDSSPEVRLIRRKRLILSMRTFFPKQEKYRPCLVTKIKEISI